MSICRWGCDGSDIYMYEHCDNFICCCGCNLNSGYDFKAASDKEALKHIQKHIENGDKVTQDTIDYFNGGIVSNVKQSDIDKEHPKPKISKAEVTFKVFDKSQNLIKGIAFGVGLQDGTNKHKRINKLLHLPP